MNPLHKLMATQAKPAAAPASAAPVVNPIKTLGLGLGKPRAAPAPEAKPATVEKVVAESDSSPSLLASIAAMDVSTVAPVRAADETPPNAIPRKLPDELTAQHKAFLASLDVLHENIPDSELLGQACVSIMIELQENPQYEQMLADADIRALIRGARDAMGLARIKKTEAKAKRGSSKKAQSAVVDADIAAIFGDLMG